MNQKYFDAFNEASRQIEGVSGLKRDVPEIFGPNEYLIEYAMTNGQHYSFVVDFTNDATIRHDLYFNRDGWVYQHPYHKVDGIFEYVQAVTKTAQELYEVSERLSDTLADTYRRLKEGKVNE